MSQDVETPQTAPVVQQDSSRGCIYGCLAVVAIFAGLAVCGGVGLYFFVTGQIEKYTSETPAALPKVEMSAEEVDALKTRLESFGQALEEGTPTEDLVLTADEINAMINDNEKLSGRAFVKIEDGKVTGDVSFPIDELPGGKGRFFNASATLDVRFRDGVLIVTLADAAVKGEKVPQEILDGFANENLAKDLYKDPKNAEMISRFDSVEIGDDKITLKLKKQQEATEESESGVNEDESVETESSASEDAASAEGDETASEEPGEASDSGTEVELEGESDSEPNEDSVGELSAEVAGSVV